MIDGVVQRPGYQRISQSAKGNLMQIKGAEASAKLGATAHQNTWQRWSHGQFNYRSGSRTARFFRKHAQGRKVRCRIRGQSKSAVHCGVLLTCPLCCNPSAETWGFEQPTSEAS